MEGQPGGPGVGSAGWAAVGRLRGDISQPTLILQGDDDIMIPTAASYILARPATKVTIYPDVSHGSIFPVRA